MGREIKRVPMDFDFPLDRSYTDYAYDRHEETCEKREHDDCEFDRDPPEGEGWQLWQTISDGPITSVFATADELVAFMSEPVPVEKRDRWHPEAYPQVPWAQGWRREIAETFVKRCGWAPSAVHCDGVLMDGPSYVVQEFAKDKEGAS